MPCRPRGSGALRGEDEDEGGGTVGSEGSGRRLMGLLSRGPPMAGVGAWPSGCEDSRRFSVAGLSALGRVS
jgi:hypothetical protein